MQRPVIKGSVEDTLQEIKSDKGYPNMNETIRNVLREAGYNNV